MVICFRFLYRPALGLFGFDLRRDKALCCPGLEHDLEQRERGMLAAMYRRLLCTVSYVPLVWLICTIVGLLCTGSYVPLLWLVCYVPDTK